MTNSAPLATAESPRSPRRLIVGSAGSGEARPPGSKASGRVSASDRLSGVSTPWSRYALRMTGILMTTCNVTETITTQAPK